MDSHLTTAASLPPLILTPPEKYLLILWNVISALISTLGNTAVLIAALKYHSIKLDRVSVILITNTAVADIGFTLTCIMPSIFNVASERSMFGTGLSSVLNLADEVFLAADIYLLCCLNISKLTSLLQPLRTRSRTRKAGWIIAVLVWLFSALTAQVVPYWLCSPQQVFDPATYQCNHSFKDRCHWMVVYFALLILFIPFLIILVTSVWLLIFAAMKKRSTGLAKTGVLTMMLVSINFFISNAPYTVLFTIMASGTDVRTIPDFPRIYRFVVYILNLNFVSNPIIYYLSIASFNRFVKEWLCCERSNRTSVSLSRRVTQIQNPGFNVNLQ